VGTADLQRRAYRSHRNGAGVAYPYIPGSQSDAFRGLSILAGVLLSIGSGSAMANVVAGYMLIYRRSFSIGDRVKIGEVIGDVTDLRLQVTHIRTPKNEEVTVPNSAILASEVVNYSRPAREGKLLLSTKLGIGYEVPWRQVEAMLVEAARRTAVSSRTRRLSCSRSSLRTSQ